MRRIDRKVESREWLLEVIKKADVLRLGLCADNVPYVVPVNFGYVDNTFYFHCAKEGRKLDMIQKNSYVCFELDVDHKLVIGEQACQYTMQYKSIIGYGHAEVCTTKEDKLRGINAVMAHFSEEQFSYNPKAMDRITVVKILVDDMSGKEAKPK